jgi:glucokinase
MAHARHAFAMACAGFVNAFNPELIVVGGSIAEHQGDRLLGPARDEIRRGAFATPGGRVRVVAAELGPDVSLAGSQPLVSGRLQDERWRRGRARLGATPSSRRP